MYRHAAPNTLDATAPRSQIAPSVAATTALAAFSFNRGDSATMTNRLGSA